ncbi:hypothetical protein RA210_U10565 [Rubrivivax sp. A210]|nr:hypothetical protein RA210_U10565 [Rubrivivax sp. A210]
MLSLGPVCYWRLDIRWKEGEPFRSINFGILLFKNIWLRWLLQKVTISHFDRMIQF